jgi:hypothetical protein
MPFGHFQMHDLTNRRRSYDADLVVSISPLQIG